MNIAQAKEYIKNSIRVYLKKDAYGDYRIPVVRQRPVFLLGAPGIGKTAIMEQIAQELGIALVSYSMTHHTRQSALGLPFIKQKKYGEQEYEVSEYTMSEIIASVYDTMEESGVKEGILFLDEINCVSETLAPSMLQFLQYKVFGKHKVPEGWVIVTAGNPPEYNKSVREFDVVTLDRLKVLEIEADYGTWKLYAAEKGIHSAILNFLELKKEFFYHMETTAAGRSYVTARGWEDLSEMVLLYEEENLKVEESLVSQYLRSETIVKEFCAYYDLYNKYKQDYQVEALLSGQIAPGALEKAKGASFDERLSLLGLLMEQVQKHMKEAVETSDAYQELMAPLRALKEGKNVTRTLLLQADARVQLIKNLESANTLSSSERKKHKRILAFLRQMEVALKEQEITDDADAFATIKAAFEQEVAKLKELVAKVQQEAHYLFLFVAQAFGREGSKAGEETSSEMLVLVTELTVNTFSSRFIATYGCEDYHQYNKLLMVSNRQVSLKEDISKLVL